MTVPGETPSPSPYYTEADFWVGFVGWYVVNALAWVVLGRNSYGYSLSVNLLFLPINALVLLITARKRPRFAAGLLAAIALNFILALISGAFTNAVCAIPFFIR